MSLLNNIKIAVIGGGSWATALIKILCEQNNVQIRWWLRNQKDIEHIRKFHHNPSYLSDVVLSPKKVKVFEKTTEAVKGADYVILAVPAAFIQEALRDLSSKHLQGKRIVSAIKGMVPDQNMLITDWVAKEYGIDLQETCVIAGPCHAEEVALEKQSYLSIASTECPSAEDFAKLMTCRYVTANPLDDLYGVEYAAVMKNIVALACGITHGLGYGDNFQAVLVSNAMQEIGNFVTALDPRERNMSSSAYLGDLLVTAYSQFSRNRLFGNMIGRGYSVKAAQLEMKMIAEGYYATKSITEMNKIHQVSLPITSAVYRILYEEQAPGMVMDELKKLLK
ncbi:MULTISPECIES: NAD(P)H-dependent glycerol-3-phosphate dehydrogenase [Dyadobacter]|uniref:Glycerol-3-phosphate dehydrogenase [NAD(P)+] n=1 Tax=Dyadobacter chenhuakuii TaxID=2909339 RepID=A0ABY4XJV5_9BACT|nr:MULTISPECIES: NAD(P)H-dependent glycerol-3-phosphate dehydrogenase [Dyadobacter]MCE7071507.1 NAD(P)H-dependent glycerol-3-phosphate dehydrogenase [Dyadobacter sp. CY327]MCF2493602.1 NAD(P)H-dependent glycerol-3-phosphate dehydrogenase [Dyadobacter chenhuakuii]USJ30739.1 NAD(P)H-dependent glycerol-3-phosphate dehydrogenase [Dyadobacter chenhuakuii]